MPGADFIGDTIGELAIKVVPDLKNFGPDVSKGVGASLQTASRVGLGAVTAVGGGLLALGTQLDSAYDNIRTQTGATGDELVALQGTFDEVAKNVPASLDDVGTAVAGVQQHLGDAGFDVEALSEQLLDLSHITDTDVNTNLEATSDLFRRFGVDADEAESQLDKLFRASQFSGESVSDLATSLTKGAGTLDLLGLSLDEGTDLLALLAKNGINGDKALVGLNKVIANAAKEGKPAGEAFHELFDAIKNAPDETTAAGLAIEAFGAKSGANLASSIRQGLIAIDDLGGGLGESKDTISGVADETADAAETFKQLKNTLAISLGPAANRLFTSFGKAATDMAPALEMVVNALAPLLEAVASLPAPLLAAGVGTLAIGASASKIIGPLKGLSAAFKLLAANPYIILAAATVALVVIIIKNWDKIKAFLIETWDKIKGALNSTVEALKAAWQWLADKFTEISDSIVAAFNTFVGYVDSALQPIVDVFQTVFDKVSAVFDVFFTNAQQATDTWIGRWTTVWNTMFGWFTTAWDTTWDAVTTAITTARDVIMVVVQPVVDFFQTIMPPILATFQTAWGITWTAVSTAVSTAWSVVQPILDFLKARLDNVRTAMTILMGIGVVVFGVLKSVIGGAIDFLIQKLDQLKNKLSDMLGPLGDVGGKIGGLAGKAAGGIGGTLKAIGGFAEGGVVGGPLGAPQLAIVHGGEEVLTPSQRGRGGTRIVNLNINGPITLDSQERIYDLRRTIYDQEQREAFARGEAPIA